MTTENAVAGLQSEIGMTDEDIQAYLALMDEYCESIDYLDITDQLNSDAGLLNRIERMNVFHFSWLTIFYMAVGIPAVILLAILLLVIRFVVRRAGKRRGKVKARGTGRRGSLAT